ncbi:B3GNL protein, partial [Acrocephalus arundinaceus]|nr:B3GNL protein [Acrocephalus arundinaceus]
SIIVPVHNSECWLDECLKSVWEQDFKGTMELSIFNDASKDGSAEIIEKWKIKLEEAGVSVIIGNNNSSQPRGVGFAKNQAIIQSSGTYLCFLDSDDVMMPQRVRLQHEVAIQHPNSIIGCQVRREPVDSTERYTRWINNLTQEQLLTQVFTSHGPTVIMPTWFCSREWFFHVGRFDEGGKGVPEDLLFFYEHLQKGGGVFRVNHCLLLYRYHPQAATHSGALPSSCVHSHACSFAHRYIAGEILLLKHSAPVVQVIAFCDVDEKKITKGFYTYEESEERPKPKIPVCHFRDATPPFVICVKL